MFCMWIHLLLLAILTSAKSRHYICICLVNVPFVAVVKHVALKVPSVQPESRSSLLHRVPFGLQVEEDVILLVVNAADMP